MITRSHAGTPRTQSRLFQDQCNDTGYTARSSTSAPSCRGPRLVAAAVGPKLRVSTWRIMIPEGNPNCRGRLDGRSSTAVKPTAYSPERTDGGVWAHLSWIPEATMVREPLGAVLRGRSALGNIPWPRDSQLGSQSRISLHETWTAMRKTLCQSCKWLREASRLSRRSAADAPTA